MATRVLPAGIRCLHDADRPAAGVSVVAPRPGVVGLSVDPQRKSRANTHGQPIASACRRVEPDALAGHRAAVAPRQRRQLAELTEIRGRARQIIRPAGRLAIQFKQPARAALDLRDDAATGESVPPSMTSTRTPWALARSGAGAGSSAGESSVTENEIVALPKLPGSPRRRTERGASEATDAAASGARR